MTRIRPKPTPTENAATMNRFHGEAFTGIAALESFTPISVGQKVTLPN
jgi:hypothetical protein